MHDTAAHAEIRRLAALLREAEDEIAHLRQENARLRARRAATVALPELTADRSPLTRRQPQLSGPSYQSPSAIGR